MENPAQTLEYFTQIEEQAQEILTDRHEVVALDKRRNQNREALRALMKSDQDKAWVAMGPLLVKLPKKTATQLLNKDQVKLDVEVNKLRSDLKVKVNRLRDLEHTPPVPGLMLNALSRDEMKAVGQTWGRTT